MNTDAALRKHLVDLLTKENAHAGFDSAVEDVPSKIRGVRPPESAHSLWETLEHLRIAQRDILEFSRNAKHKSPEWPLAYWPKSPSPANDEEWRDSIQSFRDDLAAMVALIEDSSTDLFAKIPHGSGQTILREALLVADHNAYHIGQFVLLRRLLDSW